MRLLCETTTRDAFHAFDESLIEPWSVFTFDDGFDFVVVQ